MPALFTCGKYFVFKPFISFENLYEHSIKCSFFSEKALDNEKKRTTASKYDNDLLCTRVSANIAHEQKSTLVRKLRKHKRRDIRDQVSKISARWRNHVNYLLLEELESIYGKGELSKVLALKSRWHVSTAIFLSTESTLILSTLCLMVISCTLPTCIYLFKVNDKNARTMCVIYSKVTIKIA